jgi:MFS family permease
MNLICESKSAIGLQGSMYFVGVCTTILPFPILADKPFGRKWIVFISNVLLIIAMIGFIFTHNIYESYVYFFITGMSFSGRQIVGYTYLLEYFTYGK